MIEVIFSENIVILYFNSAPKPLTYRQNAMLWQPHSYGYHIPLATPFLWQPHSHDNPIPWQPHSYRYGNPIPLATPFLWQPHPPTRHTLYLLCKSAHMAHIVVFVCLYIDINARSFFCPVSLSSFMCFVSLPRFSEKMRQHRQGKARTDKTFLDNKTWNNALNNSSRI